MKKLKVFKKSGRMNPRDAVLDSIIAWLRQGVEYAIPLTRKNGEMKDFYETHYSENYSPACWSVVAAALYRLTGEKKYLQWTRRWFLRNNEISQAYSRGYVAMIFPILQGCLPESELTTWKKELNASYQKSPSTSNHAHILALDIVMSLNGNMEGSVESEENALGHLLKIESRITARGFLRDDPDHGNSVAYHYLTASILGTLFLSDMPVRIREVLERILVRMYSWMRDSSGTLPVPVQANRSAYQMFVFPLMAHLACLGKGVGESSRIQSLLDFHQHFALHAGKASPTPNFLSPYACAGLEQNFNRTINDLGAGMVAWAGLALLFSTLWKGLKVKAGKCTKRFNDHNAGYAVLSGKNSRVAFALCEHKWGYHLPLQPFAFDLGTDWSSPICGAKRLGSNHPHQKLLQADSQHSPLLEPYFGLFTQEKDYSFKKMQGVALVDSSGAYRLTQGPIQVSLNAKLQNQAIQLEYELSGRNAGSRLFFSFPGLLWDGKTELEYFISGATLNLVWKGSTYRIKALGSQNCWELDRSRHLSTGFGVTANWVIPVNETGISSEISSIKIAFEKLSL